MLKRVEPDDPADEWYFRVRDMDKPYEINVDEDTADRTRLTIFVNYRVTGDGGEFLGVTGIGHSVKSVARLIEDYEQQYGRTIFFVNDTGRVVLHGDDFAGADNIRDRPGLQQVATRLLSSPSTQTRYTDPDGRVVHVNSRLIPELGWRLIVQQTKSPAQQRILATLLLNVGIAIAITLLVSIIG